VSVDPPAPIAGTTVPAFDAVRHAFVENFAHRDEAGAAVCVVVDGQVVVDLCGGWRDGARQRPWEPDTLVNVYSVGKGIAALCVARLVGQGLLSYADPVAQVWPEFAARGKSAITVAQLLSHQAGLPAIREPLPDDAVFDWETMTTVLAEKEPWWEPGTAHGYHVNTFGFLVGELVRRTTGRSIGAMLREELTGPLGADFFMGVPRRALPRVAEFLGVGARPSGDVNDGMEYRAYFNPPTLSGHGVVNTERWRMAEMPSTNSHASARGVARLYEALVQGGRVDGIECVVESVLHDAVDDAVYGDDLILHRSSRFGLGFQLTQIERPLGPNPGSFGHFGAGGSLGFCDPDAHLAFGYTMNTMGPRWQNPRNQALIDACYTCL
jgi:CubicO group peptidase (beta-lactamase class C family)